MGYKYCKPYSGYYCGQFLRSFNEFIVAVSLELVEKKIWQTESIVLQDYKGRRKIPDFVIYDNSGKIIQIIEVKNNEEDTINTIVLYAERKIGLKGIDHQFITMTRKSSKVWIKKITDVIGVETWNKIACEYKSQIEPNVGFVGNKNPMFGRTHSEHTKKKLSEKAGRFGAANGMFRKTHNKETRKKLGRNWNDPEIKKELQRKGFIKHFSSLNEQEKQDVTKYFVNRFLGVKTIKPASLNNFYSMNKEKAIDLFGSEEEFFYVLRSN